MRHSLSALFLLAAAAGVHPDQPVDHGWGKLPPRPAPKTPTPPKLPRLPRPSTAPDIVPEKHRERWYTYPDEVRRKILAAAEKRERRAAKRCAT